MRMISPRAFTNSTIFTFTPYACFMLRSVMMSTARPNYMGFSFCSSSTLELHMKAWSGLCVVMMTA